MTNRYFKLAIFNATVLGLLGLGTMPYAHQLGNFLIAMASLLGSAALFIFATNWKDEPPRIDEVRQMTRELWRRLFS